MNVRDIMEIGSYELPNDCSPNDIHVLRGISWIVLAVEADRALLISKDCLAWELFDGSNSIFEPANPTSWEESYLREMLNGEFFASAFSETEKQQILETVGDKLFLLSAEEVGKYFAESSAAAVLPMVNSMSDPNAPEIWDEACFWWTKTVCDEPSRVVCVDESGSLYFDGIDCDADEVGVRPAMWIKL